jgi:hypothetical protein|tara:strand:- start:245 stop:526 length:282 start_codon:yes stop_codon:yes gene_type:complete
MIRKTFKQNIELPINDSSQTVNTEWTIDIYVTSLTPYRDEVMDIDIVSCDANLDERQYDRLKEICLAMRHIGAFDMAVIDENRMENLLTVEPV